MSSQDTQKSRLKSKTALVISLALNIFFVGTVVGGMVIGHRMQERGQSIRHAPPIHSFANPRMIMRHVDRDRRGELVKVLRSEMKAIRPLLKSVGEKRREAMTLLSAEPFDQAAAQKAFEDLATAEAKAHEASSQTVIKMLMSLPAAERARVIEGMNARREHHRRGGDEKRWRDREHPKEKHED